MTDLTTPAPRALMGEWQLALTAERKSPATVALYLDALGRYLTWAETQDLPPIRRTSLQTWITDMLGAGHSPSTARIRQQAAPLRRLAHRRRTPRRRPVQGMKSPKLDLPVIDPLTVAEVRAVLHTCQPASADDPGEPRPLRQGDHPTDGRNRDPAQRSHRPHRHWTSTWSPAKKIDPPFSSPLGLKAPCRMRQPAVGWVAAASRPMPAVYGRCAATEGSRR